MTLALGCIAQLGCSRDRPAEEPHANVQNERLAEVPAQEPVATEAEVPREHEAPPGHAEGTPAQSATDAIAQSRCQREERCENVGEGRKYTSLQECVNQVRSDWKDDLSARECPEGVDQPQLAECLDKVRTEDCDAPLDTLARLAECTAGQICEG